jgi:hypothetical protein
MSEAISFHPQRQTPQFSASHIGGSRISNGPLYASDLSSLANKQKALGIFNPFAWLPDGIVPFGSLGKNQQRKRKVK